MHPAIAHGNDSRALIWDSSTLRFLPLEAKVQRLFSLEEPVLFIYLDFESENIIVVNDEDLLNLQQAFKRHHWDGLLQAFTQRRFLLAQASPTLVKSVLKRYLSNFQQTCDFQTFRQASLHVESILREGNVSLSQRRKFHARILAKLETLKGPIAFHLENAFLETWVVEIETDFKQLRKRELVEDVNLEFEDKESLVEFSAEEDDMSLIGLLEVPLSECRDFDAKTKVSSKEAFRKRTVSYLGVSFLTSGDLQNESLVQWKCDSRKLETSNEFDFSNDLPVAKQTDFKFNASFGFGGFEPDQN